MPAGKDQFIANGATSIEGSVWIQYDCSGAAVRINPRQTQKQIMEIINNYRALAEGKTVRNSMDSHICNFDFPEQERYCKRGAEPYWRYRPCLKGGDQWRMSPNTFD